MITNHREIIENIAFIVVLFQTWYSGYFIGKHWVWEDTIWGRIKIICIGALFSGFGVVILAGIGLVQYLMKIWNLVLNDNWIPVYAIWRTHVTGYEYSEKQYERISKAIKHSDYKTLKKRWIYKIFTTALEKRNAKVVVKSQK